MIYRNQQDKMSNIIFYFLKDLERGSRVVKSMLTSINFWAINTFAVNLLDQTSKNLSTCQWSFGEWTPWEIQICSDHNLASTKFWVNQFKQFVILLIQKTAQGLFLWQLIHSAQMNLLLTHNKDHILLTLSTGVITSFNNCRWHI